MLLELKKAEVWPITTIGKTTSPANEKQQKPGIGGGSGFSWLREF